MASISSWRLTRYFTLRAGEFGVMPPTLAKAFLLPLALAAMTQVHAGEPDDTVEELIVIGSPDSALVEIERVPGGVEIVPDTAFKSTPVQHIKDILDYVPGVITQRRMGDDARVSVRGSGLSRAYGARGVSLTLDGIPLNTSDGLVDFFEIDPSAYRYVEVYKGANALRYGTNALGGAINLVTPRGHDVAASEARLDTGSFGYAKAQASTGGVVDALDYFATLSAQRNDGYRAHSNGTAVRGNLNLGYRLSQRMETRFYTSAATTRQRIPGEVTLAQALNAPRLANPVWVEQDQQRNVDSIRIANKTTFTADQTTFEAGAFYNYRHVDHPIYQYLDYTVDDYGGFARAVNERTLAGMTNRLVMGANVHNGTIDTEQFLNLPGAVKGALAASMDDKSRNAAFYLEDSLFVRPELALIVGVQYLEASRERSDRFLSNGDQSGHKRYSLWSPRFGVLWDAGQSWQLFANVSRSAEIPTYDANSFATPANANLQAQRATTYEIGTRGQGNHVGWDISLYRTELDNELQCLTTAPWSPCSIINADRTVHQGVELGLGVSLPVSLLVRGDAMAVNLAYTYNDFFFDGDTTYGDNRLPGVPRHYLRAELLYQHPGGFYAGPNLEWAPGHYFADNANSLRVAPYALLNFRTGFDAGNGWSIYLEGRNLTDRSYIATVAAAGIANAASELFNPGTGRAVFAGVRFDW